MTALVIVKFVSRSTGKSHYAITIEHDGDSLTSISTDDERTVGFMVALAGAGGVEVKESRQVMP